MSKAKSVTRTMPSRALGPVTISNRFLISANGDESHGTESVAQDGKKCLCNGTIQYRIINQAGKQSSRRFWGAAVVLTLERAEEAR